MARRRDRASPSTATAPRAVRLLPDRRQRLDGPPDGSAGARLGADAGDARADAGRPRPPGCPTEDDDWGYEMSWGGRAHPGVRLRRPGPPARRRRRRRHVVVSGDPAARRRAGADRGGARRRDRRVRRHRTVGRAAGTAQPAARRGRGAPGRGAYARCSSWPLICSGWRAIPRSTGPLRGTPRTAGRAVGRRATTGRRRRTSPAAASSRSRPPPRRACPAWSRNGWTRPICPAGAAGSGSPSATPDAGPHGGSRGRLGLPCRRNVDRESVDDPDVVDVPAEGSGLRRLVVTEIDTVDRASGEGAQLDPDKVPPVHHQVSAGSTLQLRMDPDAVLVDDTGIAQVAAVGQGQVDGHVRAVRLQGMESSTTGWCSPSSAGGRRRSCCTSRTACRSRRCPSTSAPSCRCARCFSPRAGLHRLESTNRSRRRRCSPGWCRSSRAGTGRARFIF